MAEKSLTINNYSPSTYLRISAILFYYFKEQCISKDNIAGLSSLWNAYSLTVIITSLNLISLTSVWPCVTIGSPSLPSQQSNSTHLNPCLNAS